MSNTLWFKLVGSVDFVSCFISTVLSPQVFLSRPLPLPVVCDHHVCSTCVSLSSPRLFESCSPSTQPQIVCSNSSKRSSLVCPLNSWYQEHGLAFFFADFVDWIVTPVVVSVQTVPEHKNVKIKIYAANLFATYLVTFFFVSIGKLSDLFNQAGYISKQAKYLSSHSHHSSP